MSYSINEGLHSADKDHREMTGGTLKVDKTVECKGGVTFYTYSIPMYTSGAFDEDFHKGVHTAEHMIAYKQDTGSVRDSLEEVSYGEKDGKVILDISPFKTSENTFGFRITSMIPLPIEEVQALTKLSIERAINYLESGKQEVVENDNEEDFEGIPFARSIACGQYDFHDRARAIQDLKQVNTDNLKIEETEIHTEHKTAYVCDLRFLKPKTFGSGDNMVTFSPDFSYKISLLIEEYLPTKLPGSIAIVGTFGCMTGMYLCISSGRGDESDIPLIHEKIIEILKENIQNHTLDGAERLQLKTLLENYQKYS